MKKVLFVLLALCLFVVPVMAQETPDDPVVLNWDELADQYVEAGFSGTLYAFNDLGIRLLIPEGYEQQELSEESIENGIEGAFVTEDGEKQIIISLRDLGVETLEEVALLAKDSFGEDFHYGGYYKLNGLNSIMFMNSDTEELTVAVSTTEPNYFIQVSIRPMTDEDVNAQSGYIIGSIQPLEEE